MSLVYVGRADGIGNRVEEILYLIEYSLQENVEVTYIWNNPYRGRNDRCYSLCFSSSCITIHNSSDERPSKLINFINYKPSNKALSMFSFTYKYELMVPFYYAVHIRTTDRLSSKEKLHESINQILKRIKNKVNIPTPLYICSDNYKWKQLIENLLNEKYTIIQNPLKSEDEIPNDTYDFYALTYADCVYSITQYNEFSSYATTACMLSNKYLITYSSNKNITNNRFNIKIINLLS
jgi:hypothetical protein